MSYKTEPLLQELLKACDAINKDAAVRKHISEDSVLRDILKEDCIKFLMYLSASDGNIAKKESEFIKDIWGTDYSTDEIKTQIQDENLYSAAFESTVPLSLKCFVACDNKHPQTDRKTASNSEHYFHLFETMGKEFIACDHDACESEVEDLTIYLTTLQSYINSEGKFPTSLKGKISVKDDMAADSQASLQELLNELDELTGLDAVKKDVRTLVNLVQIQNIRAERGLKALPVSLHLVFTGNPGTGKTTVARLLSKIYKELGILSKGHLVEVDRSGLIAGYVGQTALKVQEVIQKALGGVLFIDEAYTLTASTSENDYGHEAVETLLKAMEDNRYNLIVIVAGYPDLMLKFLASNPGLKSRFNKFIRFPDYIPEELFDIFLKMCKAAEISADELCEKYVFDFFKYRYEHRDRTFANGRDVRNFFEQAISNQANRLVLCDQISNAELMTLTNADVEPVSLDV